MAAIKSIMGEPILLTIIINITIMMIITMMIITIVITDSCTLQVPLRM